jgi:hypothetical protein
MPQAIGNIVFKDLDIVDAQRNPTNGNLEVISRPASGGIALRFSPPPPTRDVIMKDIAVLSIAWEGDDLIVTTIPKNRPA